MKTVKTHEARDFREGAFVHSQMVGTAIITMADFGFTAQELLDIQSCTISVHQAGINFLYTGHDPTILLGIGLAVGQTAIITNNVDINNLRFVSQTGAPANVTIIGEVQLTGMG